MPKYLLISKYFIKKSLKFDLTGRILSSLCQTILIIRQCLNVALNVSNAWSQTFRLFLHRLECPQRIGVLLKKKRPGHITTKRTQYLHTHKHFTSTIDDWLLLRAHLNATLGVTFFHRVSDWLFFTRAVTGKEWEVWL